MIAVRGGSGLGDAIYLHGVVRLLRGDVEVCTDWPDVFLPIADRITISPFRKKPIDVLAHYSLRRAIVGTSQFQDCCISAGLPASSKFSINWRPRNRDLVNSLRQDRPVIVVQMPRPPFGRVDGFGMEFLPDFHVIQRAIDRVKRYAFIVEIGSGDRLFSFDGIDLDLVGKTSVSDVMDVGYAADGFLGNCSFIIPLAECFGKPVQVIWSSSAASSQHYIVRQMTPHKILGGPWSRAVMDDCDPEQLDEAIDAFLAKVRSPAMV